MLLERKVFDATNLLTIHGLMAVDTKKLKSNKHQSLLRFSASHKGYLALFSIILISGFLIFAIVRVIWLAFDKENHGSEIMGADASLNSYTS